LTHLSPSVLYPLSLHDALPISFYNLAWSANELNQYDQSAAAARKAIGLKADYPEAYAELGFASRKLNQPSEAITAYREAVRLRPDRKSTRLNSSHRTISYAVFC